MANPTAILLCAANMLSHIGLHQFANVVQTAVKKTIKAGRVGYAVSRWLSLRNLLPLQTIVASCLTEVDTVSTRFV
jgi:isocitrate dehydrogenase